MRSDRFSFVTVVYEDEIEFLWLQARSFDRFCPSELVAQIFIVDNSAHPMLRDTKKYLLSAYGNLANRVLFLAKEDFGQIPKAPGWKTQQILKLAVSRYIDTDLYIVLDAKNHLVNRLCRSFLMSNNGLAQINFYNYETHPSRPCVERALVYFNLDLKSYILCFTPAVTPFIIYKDISLSLIRYIEKREGRAFGDVFIEKNFCEFSLYSAYLIHIYGGWLGHYNFHQIFCPVLWPHQACKEKVCKAVANAKKWKCPFFSVHRRSIVKIGPDALEHLTKFLTATGLFFDQKCAYNFYNRLRRKDILFFWLNSIGVSKRIVAQLSFIYSHLYQKISIR